jgi:hypothetical protein
MTKQYLGSGEFPMHPSEDDERNTLSVGASSNTDPVAGREKPQGEPASRMPPVPPSKDGGVCITGNYVANPDRLSVSNNRPEQLTSNLLPCPFCGIETDADEFPFPLDRERKHWAIRCQDAERCEVEVVGTSPDDAIARWNKRAAVPPAAPASNPVAKALRKMAAICASLRQVAASDVVAMARKASDEILRLEAALQTMTAHRDERAAYARKLMDERQALNERLDDLTATCRAEGYEMVKDEYREYVQGLERELTEVQALAELRRQLVKAADETAIKLSLELAKQGQAVPPIVARSFTAEEARAYREFIEEYFDDGIALADAVRGTVTKSGSDT